MDPHIESVVQWCDNEFRGIPNWGATVSFEQGGTIFDLLWNLGSCVEAHGTRQVG